MLPGGLRLYPSSKAALNGTGKSVVCDLSNQGVVVALMHPMYVKVKLGKSDKIPQMKRLKAVGNMLCSKYRRS